MELPKLRYVSVIVAVSVLTVSLGWLSPAAAQDVEPAPPAATFCAPASSLTIASDVLTPAPIDQQVTCGPCILDSCFAAGVRCTFVGCGINNECCRYSCECDQSCASGGIPFNACPISLPNCNCGNGVIDPGEDCDGANLNGETCESLGFHSGTLTCTSSCTFNTNQCTNPVCGNGTCEWGEDCESCSNDCEGESTGKPTNRFCCGNGVLEQAEGDGTRCDGNP